MSSIPYDIGIAVFDPYHIGGEEWQWSNVQTDADWNEAARQVHKGWPAKIRDWSDEQAEWYGVINEGGDTFWAYRVYPGGRDRFGRPGRYFFVLCKLRAPSDWTSPLVTTVLKHFSTERSLPLNVKPLQPLQASEALPSAGQTALGRLLNSPRREGHWGISDKDPSVVVFAAPPPKIPPPVDAPLPVSSPFRIKLPAWRPLWAVAGVVLASICMHGCYRQGYNAGHAAGEVKGYNRGLAEAAYNQQTPREPAKRGLFGWVRGLFGGGHEPEAPPTPQPQRTVPHRADSPRTSREEDDRQRDEEESDREKKENPSPTSRDTRPER